MTTTRFLLARPAAVWVWVLPLGLSELAMACGSSPGMVGISAGAAGVNIGAAGTDSTRGGSGSAHAGSPGITPTAGSTGDAGGGDTGGSTGDTGGAASAAGSPSTGGGAVGAAGASSAGGASGAVGAAGASSAGGAVGAAGASSAGGASGTSGTCVKNADCGTGNVCLYKITDSCAAKGSCHKGPTGPTCASFVAYCGCSGQVVGVPCYEPEGYAPAPVSSQQSAANCAAVPDAACGGKACGASCGTSEVPSLCDVSGKCVAGGAPICK